MQTNNCFRDTLKKYILLFETLVIMVALFFAWQYYSFIMFEFRSGITKSSTFEFYSFIYNARESRISTRNYKVYNSPYDVLIVIKNNSDTEQKFNLESVNFVIGDLKYIIPYKENCIIPANEEYLLSIPNVSLAFENVSSVTMEVSSSKETIVLHLERKERKEGGLRFFDAMMSACYLAPIGKFDLR